MIGPPRPPPQPALEYLGFRNGLGRREYLLTQRYPAGPRDYTVWIADSAFAARQVLLQDGPAVCYEKLLGLLAAPEPTAERCFEVTANELLEYRTAHTPAKRQPFAPKQG